MVLRQLPIEEWPREKLIGKGPGGLSNVELLAIILGKGRRGKDVLQLATEVMEGLSKIESEVRLEDLCSIDGIGFAKACQILASLEFSKRFLTTRKRVKIRTASDALAPLCHLKASPQEEFVVMTLDGSHQVIGTHTVTVGLVNQSQVHPRETFRHAIQDQAVSILIAHNHPSGNLEPSESDLFSTRRLVDASRTVGIPIIDHLIVGPNGFVSLRETHPTYFT